MAASVAKLVGNQALQPRSTLGKTTRHALFIMIHRLAEITIEAQFRFCKRNVAQRVEPTGQSHLEV
jgi:hypothetical protein